MAASATDMRVDIEAAHASKVSGLESQDLHLEGSNKGKPEYGPQTIGILS